MHKIRHGDIIRLKTQYRRVWVALELTQKDIDNGVCELVTDTPGIILVSGLWYEDKAPTNIRAYGKGFILEDIDTDYDIIGTVDDITPEIIKELN